jgi:hypothetical protein
MPPWMLVAGGLALLVSGGGHAARPSCGDAMLLLVLPLTAVTLVVLTVRAVRARRRTG